MQCPSCGFENIPGSAACVVCSTGLSAPPVRESVLPPRAKDRSLWQRISWPIRTWPGWTESTERLREQMSAVRQSFGGVSVPIWARPRNWGLILLSVIPGVGRILMRQSPRAGGWMLAASVTALLLALLLYKTPVADILVYSVIALSIYSVTVTVDSLRRSIEGPLARPLGGVGVLLLVISAYLGGYTLLRLAISPVAMVAQVMNPESQLSVRSYESLLIWRITHIHRGDLVMGNPAHNAQLFGPVVGMPGDKIIITDRIFLNGVPLAAPVRQTPELQGQLVEVTLTRDQYWVQPDVRWPHDTPNMDQAQDFAELLARGGVVERSEIVGKVVAVIGPPSHRRMLAPVPVTKQ